LVVETQNTIYPSTVIVLQTTKYICRITILFLTGNVSTSIWPSSGVSYTTP